MDTFYTFVHKYLFVKQLRFKENSFLRVQSLCIFTINKRLTFFLKPVILPKKRRDKVDWPPQKGILVSQTFLQFTQKQCSVNSIIYNLIQLYTIFEWNAVKKNSIKQILQVGYNLSGNYGQKWVTRALTRRVISDRPDFLFCPWPINTLLRVVRDPRVLSQLSLKRQ